MTNAQKEIFDNRVEHTKQMIASLLSYAETCAGAIVGLPCVGEDGQPVINRDNRDMERLAQYHIHAALDLLNLLPSIDAEEVRVRYRPLRRFL